MAVKRRNASKRAIQPQGFPRVNKSDRLSQSLVFSFTGGQSRTYNSVDRSGNTIIGSLVKTGEKGALVSGFEATYGTGSTDKITTSLTKDSQKRSWFFRGLLTSFAASRLTDIGDNISAIGGDNINSILIACTYSGGLSALYTLTAPPAVNTVFNLHVTWDRTSTNIPRAYLNGVEQSVTNAGTPPVGVYNVSTSPVLLGNRANNTRCLPGYIEQAYIWDDILTPADVAEHNANPYRLLQPATRTRSSVATGAYTLTAVSASYSLTGQATGLAFNRVLAADTTSYALSGQAATLAFNRAMVAASAAYTLTGQDTGLVFNRVLTADTTSYTLTGQNVTLTYTPIGGPTYTLIAASASYALTGQDTGLAFNRVLTADTTAYTLNGQATGLARGWTLTADNAAYSLTGSATTFIYNRVLAADSASYALTGQAATLTYTPLTYPAIGRPVSDTSNTGWLPSTGGALYPMVDEVIAEYADFIYATNAGSVCEMALNTTAYPGTASQVFEFIASSAYSNTVQARLKNTGGATVATWTQALTATPTTYQKTLTAGEIAAIASGALSLELTAV